jgi:hypothetical protein
MNFPVLTYSNISTECINICEMALILSNLDKYIVQKLGIFNPKIRIHRSQDFFFEIFKKGKKR